MHLQSLTLKGFKSFAQATTFAFEPGVTCIVGPNGSGKSNVVDALAWVMGEQGAKTLRGGSMADVIFAGTATRGPLGRAEVALAIDNADGALPIDYTEVSITRTLFRNGASEYAINGTPCRLLDVQELLSDSGLGREMHVIVGQGRLDEVLRATPDERRGFIEEAAGVLKHRRRKERTLKKLDAMQANLTRLTDLAAEVGRQLKPLGAQAATAREAARIQAAVRAARTRLIAQDVATARSALAGLDERLHGLAAEQQLARDEAGEWRRQVADLEEAETTADLDTARRAALELAGVQQRFASLAQLAATRIALLADLPEAPQQVPDDASPEQAAAALAALDAEAATARDGRARAERRLAESRAELAALDARLAEQAAVVAKHERRIGALAAAAGGADTRLTSAEAEVQRREAALAAATERAATADQALAGQPDEGTDPDLARRADAAEGVATAAARAASDRRDALHDAERRVAVLEARADALRAALGDGDATEELVASGVGGIRGRVTESVEVDGGWEAAIAAGLGPRADAALASDHAAALKAIEASAGLGAVEVVPARPGGAPPASAPRIDGAVPAAGVVRAPAGVLALLAPVLLVETLVDAERVWPLVRDAVPPVVVVTRAGEVVSAAALRSPGSGRSGIELSAELGATEERLAEARSARAAAHEARDAADEAASAASVEHAALAARLTEQRHRAQQAERARTALAARAAAAHDEAARLAAQVSESHARHSAATMDRDRARAELQAARAEPRPLHDTGQRRPALQAAESARDALVVARLGAESATARIDAERRRHAEAAARRLRLEQAAVAAARRAAERARQRDAATGVLEALPAVQASVERSVTVARERLADLERRRAEAAGARQRARERSVAAVAALAALDERARGLDLQAYEQRLTLGTLLERAAELGLDERALVGEAPEPGFDRPAEERRLRSEERRLTALGRVNPLALEEFAALTQRHAFLTEQLADLERARTDLLRIVDELDTRVARIFEAAFEDTRDAFARIFPILFPDGSGRLSLTDPANPAASGIDVAVRPAGKRIDRLSLLSGGERSLAAIAFLMAIFQARPSPFYILDEVEAALDDANLGRLLAVVEELRDESQLILITHQKRTMQIADALYGVSMRQDGVSAVVGQRMAERQRA